jgi:membrane-associated phospholipid phosphatase
MNLILQAIHSLDLSVYLFLNGFAGNWLVDHLASFEESDKLFKGGLFLAVYVYVWFRVDSQQEEQRRSILAILTGTLLAVVVCRAVADLAPYRVRPMYDLTIPHHAYSFPISPDLENWSSFPSDTAAYFFALAFGLVRLLRRYCVPILLFTAAWIGLPRLFVGIHYLSDVVVGAAIGAALVQASLNLKWLRQKFTIVLRFLEAKPHIFYAASFLALFEMGNLFVDVRGHLRGLFRALHGEHSRELLRIILASSGILVVVLVGALVVFPTLRRFHQRHYAVSDKADSNPICGNGARQITL